MHTILSQRRTHQPSQATRTPHRRKRQSKGRVATAEALPLIDGQLALWPKRADSRSDGCFKRARRTGRKKGAHVRNESAPRNDSPRTGGSVGRTVIYAPSCIRLSGARPNETRFSCGRQSGATRAQAGGVTDKPGSCKRKLGRHHTCSANKQRPARDLSAETPGGVSPPITLGLQRAAAQLYTKTLAYTPS